MNSSKAGNSTKRKAKEMLGSDDTEESESNESDDDIEKYEDIFQVVDIPVLTKPIIGFQIRNPTQTKESSQGNVILNHKFSSNKFKESFKLNWKQNESAKDNFHEIITNPWKVCVFNNILEDDSILYNVRQAFYELNWNTRKMDLYNFRQSVDLKHFKRDTINAIYCFLKSLMPWVAELMDVKLNNISATCSYYSDTDYLLVHDDQQEDRVVAFVLYFSDVKPWEDEWGGALQLLSHDFNHQPDKPARNIFPSHNQLVLFPVSEISYHQVDEVTNKNFCRYSINGWFHGKTKDTTPVVYRPPTSGLFSEKYATAKVCSIELQQWINGDYLNQGQISMIQEHVEENSEISLLNFFIKEKYDRICDELNALSDGEWEFVGPPNRYRYEILREENFTENIKELVDVFQSETMFRLLKGFTDLDLDKEGACMKYELQRWSPGCYCLLSDYYDWSKRTELDIVAYFSCGKIVGGETEYVAEDEEVEQALITLTPDVNTLNVVYRDTTRLTCYVSKYSRKPFYTLFCSYIESK